MPMTTKNYYCPTCGNKEPHSTNHTGEIYCNCKACGNSPLYCADVNEFENRPYIQAVLHCYQFNTEDSNQKQAYIALKRQLRVKGFTCFESLELSPAGSRHVFSFAAWRAHDGETIRLYDPEQFSNQYVSNIGRVFQWKQAIYPNRHIKEGYFLEIL